MPSRYVSLGETAIEFGLPIMDLLKEMYDGNRKYKIKAGQYVFETEVPEEPKKPTKGKLLEIGTTFENILGPKFTEEEWNSLVDEYGGRWNGYYIPRSEEIKADYNGHWHNFGKDVRAKKIKDNYEPIKKFFLEEDKEHANSAEIQRQKGGETPHRLIIRDIVSKLGKPYKKAVMESFLLDSGLLDGGWVADNLGSVDAITTQPILDAVFYGGGGGEREGKQYDRDLICDAVRKNLSNPRNLRYLGMPAVNFIDYVLLHERFGIDPEQSIAVERGRKEANIMQSIIRHWDIIDGGEMFQGLRLYEGFMDRALGKRGIKDGKFNFVWLDYLSSWGPDKERAIRNLFENDHLDDPAVVFVTLNTSALEIARFERGRGSKVAGYETTDQEVTCLGFIEERCAEHDFDCEVILSETESQYADTSDMETLGFRFEKRKSGISVPVSLSKGVKNE
ncbi:MAG: hypothetical protein ISS36_02530 [Candidatus Aenigmarchaeota archaeon]|nr:hypothetical protein [Candidatus Aenigmarchaeota archaeon]